MTYDPDVKYQKSHEWARKEGALFTIGITDYAQDSLGDVVFVELPEVGKVVKKGEAFGVVESVKAVRSPFGYHRGGEQQIKKRSSPGE